MVNIRIANILEKCPWGITMAGEAYTPCNSGCGEKQRGDCPGIGGGSYTHSYKNISYKLKNKIIKLIEKEGLKNEIK